MLGKFLFKKSKWIHKYPGLLLIPFLMWMSISGILLNHPDWIASISVPSWMIPPQYTPQNWNRSSLTSAVFSKEDTSLVFFAGKQGIWRSTDGGAHFHRFEPGFETSAYYKKVRHLLMLENPEARLLAATDGGLYECFLNEGYWHPVPLGPDREAVRKILKMKDRLLVFTESNAYEAPFPKKRLQFEKIAWTRQQPVRTVTLVDLFFHLHGGSIWGLPGKLLFDLTGLVILFLSISAFYIWYFPKNLKRIRSKKDKIIAKRKAKSFRLFNRYHRKLGIWLAIIMLVIGITAFFMRPPTLVIIANGTIPSKYYPGFLPDNPWKEAIHNVLYDSLKNLLLVNAKDGDWIGPPDFNQPFIKTELDAPIFVMGATVFESYGQGGYFIGSFNGLYHWERQSARSFDIINQKYVQEWSNVRPADHMVTGYFREPGGNEFITTHEQGLLQLSDGEAIQADYFQMPRQLIIQFRMSLWNYLFELHNGRCFKDWLSGLYVLMIPLGSLLFVLITLSGIFDWSYLKFIRHIINKGRYKG